MSCAMLASPNPSALQGIVWDGGAIASREKSERSSWDSMKSKAEGFAMGRWILKQTERHRLVQSMYDGQFKTVTLWSRGPNKKRWVEEAIRDYTSHSEEHGDRLMSSDDVRKRLEMSLGDHFNIAAGSAVLLMIPSLLAFLTSYNTPRKGISCHSGTYLIYAITQVVECLIWGWEAWLKGLYGERWSEARTRAKTINWFCQMLAGFFAILTAVAGTFLQLLGVYRTCACKVMSCSLFFSMLSVETKSVNACGTGTTSLLAASRSSRSICRLKRREKCGDGRCPTMVDCGWNNRRGARLCRVRICLVSSTQASTNTQGRSR